MTTLIKPNASFAVKTTNLFLKSNMKQIDILNQQAGKNAGMTVPEGYFAEFNKRMAAALPAQEWERENSDKPVVLSRTRWQRMRPYVYMAAMFLGIWCMMKMFDLMKTSSSGSDLSENQILMSAIDNDAFYYDYCISDVSDTELYEDLYEQGVDPEDILPE